MGAFDVFELMLNLITHLNDPLTHEQIVFSHIILSKKMF